MIFKTYLCIYGDILNGIEICKICFVFPTFQTHTQLCTYNAVLKTVLDTLGY